MNNLIFSNTRALPNSSDNREFENKKQEKNKFDFSKIKNNTFKSLNEVECFLNDFQRFKNYIKLYKILK